MLTHQRGSLQGLQQALTLLEHEVQHQPLIETQPLLTPAVQAEAKTLLACDWLLFSSAVAVRAWHTLGLPFSPPKIGAVGIKTAQTLHKHQAHVALLGEPQHARGLATCFLARHPEPQGLRVGLPQGDRGLPILKELLEAQDVTTYPVVIYHTLIKPLAKAQADVIVVASPSAVQALPSALPLATTLLSIGPSTTAAISERGWTCIQAPQPNVDGLLAALAFIP